MQFAEKLILVHAQDTFHRKVSYHRQVIVAVKTGLAYSRFDGYYAVIHVPSGTQVGEDVTDDEQGVRAWIAHLANVTDWNAPAEELRKHVSTSSIARERAKFEGKFVQQSLFFI